MALQEVTCVGVVERTVKRHLKPAVAIAQGQLLTNLYGLRGVLLRIGIAVERKITDIIVIPNVGERVDRPHSDGVEGGVEHERAGEVPVAVDVLGARGASAGLLVVSNHVANAVARVAVVDMRHHGLLMVLYVVVVEHAQGVGERRLQAGVTHGDVERVAVIDDVEKVGHAGLRRRSTIVYAQGAELREAVTEVERRRNVDDVAHGVDANALVILDEARALRLHHDADVEVILLTYDAQHELELVNVVLIL